MTDQTTISGAYNTATLMGDDELFDEATREQIQSIVDHKGFEGDDNIVIMPDAHYGAGAVIGFTMPITTRVSPNVVGRDIGCGMTTYGTSVDTTDHHLSIDDDLLAEIDEAIRDRVPVGYHVHQDQDYYMSDDFPWHVVAKKFEQLTDNLDVSFDQTPIYGIEYFKTLCKRVGADLTRAINSMGTLGGGNHFIELSMDTQNAVYVTVHSGSRSIGAKIAEHWQDVAHEKTFERNNLVTIPAEEKPYFEGPGLVDSTPDGDGSLYGKPTQLSIDYEQVRADYEGESIQGKIGQLESYLSAGADDENPLDYLYDEEMYGYLRDMVFAQTYASESRAQMAQATVNALDSVLDTDRPVAVHEQYESVHNWITPSDGVARKGACRAGPDEPVIVPFDMQYGTIIGRGLGNDAWNSSSAHGAGRSMSRSAAYDRFDKTDFADQTDQTFTSETPIDEIPASYKNGATIEKALTDTLQIETVLLPLLTVKAD